MEQGKNIFTVEYECGRIKEFEKKILAKGVCKAFLPMSFVYFGDTERANYDCSGYQPLANCEFRNSKEMVDLLEKCVFALIDSCGHLINPKKIELNAGTVFYSGSRKEVRFAYVPKAIPAEKTSNVFAELLKHIEKSARSKEMQDYAKVIASYIEYSNGSFFDVIHYLGELKQEIHACG
ncbi:MAG: DUF6382 domain-containing protein [Clostridiales bacterium]|nr:DUF6382 domain-containing protein [Clostridiales bacterium]